MVSSVVVYFPLLVGFVTLEDISFCTVVDSTVDSTGDRVRMKAVLLMEENVVSSNSFAAVVANGVRVFRTPEIMDDHEYLDSFVVGLSVVRFSINKSSETLNHEIYIHNCVSTIRYK